MKDFSLVIVIASVSAGLIYQAASAAERFQVPFRVVSAALQFGDGIITALFAFRLMPIAIGAGHTCG
jgi:hypothetical protein